MKKVMAFFGTIGMLIAIPVGQAFGSDPGVYTLTGGLLACLPYIFRETEGEVK